MLLDIMPESIRNVFDKFLDITKVYELRIRVNLPIIVNVLGAYYFLSQNGVTKNINESVYATKNMVELIVAKACGCSLYAVNDQLQNGFITIDGGVRIGIAGEIVFDNNKIKTIKNFSSINIRIPHEIENCSLKILNFVISNNRVLNTVIISPPGLGKTTIIRDLAKQLAKTDNYYNLLIIDERNEIGSTVDGISKFNVGNFTDTLTFCNKIHGFTNGIRSLRPDVIITDEIATKEDVDAIEYACGCGVSVIASTHSLNLDTFKNKPDFMSLIKNKTFSRYVVLSNRNGPGTIEAIYNENFALVYKD